MKTRSFRLFLLLATILLLPLTVSADATSGDWQYTLNDAGQAIVTRYFGSQHDLKMPWNLDGHIIVEIGEEAFADNSVLQSVQLPVGVMIIRTSAFRDCNQLQEVELPVRLETIEDYAFLGCTALSLVTIPDSVAEIGEECFELTTILTGSADSLAEPYARACGLQYVLENDNPSPSAPNSTAADYQYRIENGGAIITSYIGDDYEVIVPAELGGYPVRTIGTNAFSSRYGVERVILPEGLTTLERTAFRKCPGLSYIHLPSTLTFIGDNAFYQCENMQEIVIPPSVTVLEDRAFQGCTQLRHVTMSANIQNIRTYTFYQCHPSLTIYAPKGSAAERHAYSRGYRFVVTEE